MLQLCSAGLHPAQTARSADPQLTLPHVGGTLLAKLPPPNSINHKTLLMAGVLRWGRSPYAPPEPAVPSIQRIKHTPSPRRGAGMHKYTRLTCNAAGTWARGVAPVGRSCWRPGVGG